PARAVARARCAARTATSASRRKARPTAVGTRPAGVRANRVTPSSRSRARICWDTDGWATCRDSAAAVTEPASATARAYSNRRRLTAPHVLSPTGRARSVIAATRLRSLRIPPFPQERERERDDAAPAPE